MTLTSYKMMSASVRLIIHVHLFFYW